MEDCEKSEISLGYPGWQIKTKSQGEKVAKKVRKDNLVVLAYASNSCYVTVLELSKYEKMDPSLVLDFRQGGWLNCSFNLTRFGDRRPEYYQKGPGYHQPCREGIIGIYDRTNLKHLKSMVFAATEATLGPGYQVD